MKRLLVITVIIQLLSNQEAFAELAKLPFLFHHYSETAADKDFFTFIRDHYSDGRHLQDDHEHGKLPFKHSEDGCTHHPTAMAFKEIKTEEHLNLHAGCSEACRFPLTEERNFPVYHKNIWQPPKLLI